MGVRVIDLREKAQPIAAELVSQGFNMIDLLSLGILELDGKDANEIGAAIKVMKSGESVSARAVVQRAEARTQARDEKLGQK